MEADNGAKRKFGEKKEQFTHFFSIPLNYPKLKVDCKALMRGILAKVDKEYRSCFDMEDVSKLHITICMLDLFKDEVKEAASKIFNDLKPDLARLLEKNFALSFEGVRAFWNTRDPLNPKPTVLYLEIKEDVHYNTLNEISNLLISNMIKKGVVSNDGEYLKNRLRIDYHKEKDSYKPCNYHVTLFRIKSSKKSEGLVIDKLLEEFKSFALGPVETKRIDLSTRFHEDEEKFYKPHLSLTI